MELDKLKKIGLTRGEVSVYDALLELGESTKTPISEKSNISPSKVYDVLHRLIEKGIASVIKRGNVQYFRAANPHRLKEYINEKESEIKKEKEIIEELMPSLLLRFQKTEEETDAEIFKGWKGIETVYNQVIEIMKSKETIHIFGASKGEDDELTRTFFNRFNKKRHEKGIKLKIIFNEEARDNIPTLNPKYDEAKYMDQTTPSEIAIYNDKIIVLVLSKKPLSVVIKNQKVADSFKVYFDAVWKIAKE